jgi:pimeloyl-ACP methyl ester carboxylesterase
MPTVQANGLTIAYEDHGDKAAPPLLLVMGFSCQLSMWPMSFVKGLTGLGFRVITFDNRDIGLSTHLDSKGMPDIGAAMMAAMTGERYAGAPYVLDDMALDAAGLLDALGIASAHIVGASMGGMIAQVLAIKHAARVRSMVSIMSTTGRPGLPAAAPEVSAALITPPASPARADRIAHGKHMWRTIGSPGYPATDAELEAVIAMQVDRAPYDPAGIARQLVAIMASEPRHELLKSVSCPAMVLHGIDDPLVNIAGGRDTAASIPGAKLVEVKGMGHDFTEALVPVLLEHAGGFCARAEAQAKAA